MRRWISLRIQGYVGPRPEGNLSSAIRAVKTEAFYEALGGERRDPRFSTDITLLSLALCVALVAKNVNSQGGNMAG